MFHLLSDIRVLRGRPDAQRERAEVGLGSLVGASTDFAKLYARPKTRRLAWFLKWIGEDEEPGDVDTDLRCSRHAGRASRLFRLFVSELYRQRREGHLDGADELAELPTRQRQVLDRLLEGQGAKQIAWELGISRRTVDEHVKALYRKFDVDGRFELLARFMPGEVAAEE